MEPRRAYYQLGPKDFRVKVLRNNNMPAQKKYLIRHWHAQMEICYVKKGRLRFFSLQGETDVTAGQFYLIPPEEIHGVRTKEDGSIYYNLLFSLEAITVPEAHFFHLQFVKPLREGRLLVPRTISPADPAYEAITGFLFAILDANEADADYKSRVFLNLIGFCLALIPHCTAVDNQVINMLTGARSNNTIYECQKYLAANRSRRITLEELADHVHLHPNYLCKLFKDHTGQTIFEFLNSIRISYATQMIRNSAQPLQAIAEACGYTSMSYFSKKFKEHTGNTPFAYSSLYKNR